jgi:sirohydrochlorin ferrochelatase
MPVALLLVDHGSKQAEANHMLEDVAALLRQRRPGLIIQTAHMGLAAPGIAQGFAQCVRAGATEVVVHPYMLAAGRHAAQDIPRLVAEAARTFPKVAYRVTEPLGVHERLAELVLERAGL